MHSFRLTNILSTYVTNIQMIIMPLQLLLIDQCIDYCSENYIY